MSLRVAARRVDHKRNAESQRKLVDAGEAIWCDIVMEDGRVQGA